MADSDNVKKFWISCMSALVVLLTMIAAFLFTEDKNWQAGIVLFFAFCCFLNLVPKRGGNNGYAIF